MSQIDFSNAKIEPASTWQGVTLQNPTKNTYVSLNANNDNYIYDSAGSRVGSLSKTVSINQEKRLVMTYQGTFSASGTEFYIGDNMAAWKVTNISFGNNDTYSFQVRADLICQ